MSENPSVTIEKTSNRVKTLRLVGEVTVFQAMELHRLAMAVARENSDVRLDCEELRSIDLAAGQVLSALQRVLSSQGRELDVQPRSKDLAELFTLVGLEETVASFANDEAVMSGGDAAMSQSVVE